MAPRGPRPYPPAGRLGISYERARRLRKNGLNVQPDGTYDLTEARAFDAARRARTPGLESDAARSWNNRLKKAKALRAEHDLAISLQLVVDVDEVRRQWRRQTEQIRNRLTIVGRELVPRIAHRGPQEILAIMDQHMLQILRELARGNA